MPKKCVLILLDGAGDRSYEKLERLTPLQAAHTPVLDGLAEKGANGLYHASSVGLALPSENAHFIMFGYAMEDFPGRGPLEALGANIELDYNDVAVLGHLDSLNEADGRLSLEAQRPAVSGEEAKDLINSISAYEQGEVQVRFHQTKGLFGVVILKGGVTPFFTDSDPMSRGRTLMAVKPLADYANDDKSRDTAAGLHSYLSWAYHVLKKHPINKRRLELGLKPVNGVVTQRAGRLKKVVSFREKYGLRGLSISSGFIYWGLCSYLGMDYNKAQDTNEPGEDIANRLAEARKALDDYDFIHVHTKAPDEAAHSKDPLAKKSVLELLDKGIGRAIGPLIDDPDVLVIVASDHSTPSSGPLIHSGEAVPLLFCGEGVRRDGAQAFNEVSAAGGALGCIRGNELMYLVLNHLERAKLMGVLDTPVDRLFWPGNYEPFLIQ